MPESGKEKKAVLLAAKSHISLKIFNAPES
jgi:hypothetical protein